MSTPESPSVLLRRAASLMRERAEKATPGPWRAHEDHGDWYVSSVEWGQVTTGINEDPAVTDHVLIERDKADAEHVAGMDPLVALAVADLLDRAAKEAGECLFLGRPEGDPEWFCATCDGMLALDCHLDPALAVARAYLGSTTSASASVDGEFELAAILAAHPDATFPELARAVLADGRFGRLGGGGHG